MQSTDIPQRLSQPFASTAGQRNAIPITTSTPGEASFVQGFPPETMLPVSAGGVPPDGKDMNGVLFLATGAAAWSAAAGGLYPYNSAYSTLIGGYPKGAVLLMADLSGLWLSTAENNATNPDALGAGWTPATETGFSGLALTTGTVTLTAAQAAKPQIGLAGTLVGNVVLVFPPWVSQWNIFNGTTGAFTVTAKTAAGAGVVLQQGNVNEVYSNGTDFNYALAFASESTYGVAAVATQATVNAGANDNEFVTPLKMATYVAAALPSPSLAARAMIYFDSTGAEIFRIDPDNIIDASSKPSTGTYEVTPNTAFPSNYMIFGLSGVMLTQNTKTTSGFTVQTRDPTNGLVIDAGPTQVSIYY